jgi:hypothetical protein
MAGKFAAFLCRLCCAVLPIGALDHASHNYEKEARKLHNSLKNVLKKLVIVFKGQSFEMNI